MNFIDKIRIKRNPNIVDSFSSDKIKSDVITYAINCGYKFNPDTMEKFISYPNYRNAFKDEDKVFNYFKQAVLIDTDGEARKKFYQVYSDLGMKRDRYISLVKADEELSKDFVEKIELWLDIDDNFNIKNVIEIIDGKEDLLDELLQNHLDTIKSEIEFKEFAEYVALNKTPQELYDQNVKNEDINNAFINMADPQNFLELFENFNEYEFNNYQNSYLSSILNNIEAFIPYLEKLDELYNTKMHKSFLNDDIKTKAIEYLKENNVLYNRNIPKFALEDDEYVLQCIRTSSYSITNNGRFEKFQFRKI